MAHSTVNAFIKSYKIPEATSPAERLAEFLDSLANHFPGEYVDKRVLTRIAHNLPAVPRENNDHVKKLSYHLTRANEILVKKYGKRKCFDKVDGYRATATAQDLHDNAYLKDVRRVEVAQRAALRTAGMIDTKKLPAHMRDHFTKSAGIIKGIGGQMANLPQLPPAPKKA